MNNSFIKLYYDFVEEERISLNDEVIDGLTLSTLINEQLDKIKSFIKDGTYIDIDVPEIKNSFWKRQNIEVISSEELDP